jgi:hypothetical protein
MSERFFTVFAAQLAAKYPPVAGRRRCRRRGTGFFATLWAFLKRLFGSGSKR